MKQITQTEFNKISDKCPWRNDNRDCTAQIINVYAASSSSCGCCGSETTFSYEACDIQFCGVIKLINEALKY